jgi:hypothetical protein
LLAAFCEGVKEKSDGIYSFSEFTYMREIGALPINLTSTVCA